MNQPTVSIITPSFNQTGFIEESIETVKRQGYPRVEHIIVDGGSDDGTVDILKSYESEYDLKWISEPDNGQSNAINKGIAMSTGDWIGWINADDFYLPRALDGLDEIINDHPEADVIYGDYLLVNEDGTEVYETIFSSKPSHFTEKYWEPFTGNHCMLLSTDVFDQIGTLDESLEYTMDLDLFWRIVNSDLTCLHIPRIMGAHRRHEHAKTSGMSEQNRRKLLDERERIYGQIDRQPTPLKYIQQGMGFGLRTVHHILEGVYPGGVIPLSRSIGAIRSEIGRKLINPNNTIGPIEDFYYG